jgi:hypothetical protein
MTNAPAHSMHGGDPADRPEASYWPEPADEPIDLFSDTLADLCREACEQLPPACARLARQAFAKVVSEGDLSSVRQAERNAVVRFMQQAREASGLPDLAYFVACWQLAFELDDNGESQTAVAKEFGKTRAAVSKRVVEIRLAATGKNVARGQKSRAAAEVYKLRQFVIFGAQGRAKRKQKNQLNHNICNQYQALAAAT